VVQYPQAGVADLELKRTIPRAAFVALRPRQWSKNLLLFAGIIFAAQLDDPSKWAAVLAIFAAFCCASSAAYLVNDVCDAPADRLHPVKRRRPIAAGELAAGAALAMAVVLAAFAFVLAGALGTESALLLVLFFALQAAYTFVLKHVVLIDLFAIAALFVVRAVAGAEAISVRVSPWLLICTGLLALFLGLAKRRSELVLALAAETPGRRVLDSYSLALIDQLVAVVAASTILAYSLYTFTARDSRAMMITIPLVVFGIFRYLLLLHRDNLGEEPERVLLSDVPIIATVAAWAVTAAIVLAVT
jgi:4-hydroxybenzoate polyprenyltransferase